MKSYLILAISGLLLLNACGSKDDVAAKKEKLKSVMAQIQTLQQEADALQEEIAILDPSSRKVTVVDVRTQPLEADTFNHFVRVQGQVMSKNDVIVTPQSAGVITRVNVETGQQVGKGQTLASIDASVLQNSIAEVKTQLALATTVYEKQKNLWERKIGSEVQYLQAKTQKEALEDRIRTMESQVALSRVTAPISGIVDQVMVTAGQTAAPGVPAFRIVNSGDLVFRADVSESYIPFVRRGQTVNLFFPSLGRSVRSQISAVGQTINPQNRTLQVEVRLPSETDYKNNMTGELSINDVTTLNALTVSVEHIRKSGSEQYVFVAEKAGAGWKARRRVITTGSNYEGQTVVTSGLNAGDLLIISGAEGLADNADIRFPAAAAPAAAAPKADSATAAPKKP